MAILRPMRFEPGTFLRPCDICGIRFRANQLVRGEDGFWRCLQYCQEMPQITRDKIIAESQRRREAPPAPFGIPFDRRNTYEAEEKIFWLLCEFPVVDSTWPGGFRSGVPPVSGVTVTGVSRTPTSTSATADVVVAGHTARYLYELINEGKRPTRWTTIARERLISLADWIITKQRGFGTSPSSTLANDPLYGGMVSSDGYRSDSIAGAALALLYAYRITGVASYLASAKAACHYLRNVQSIGQCLAADFTSSDAAGAVRLYTGGVAQIVATATNLVSNHQFHPSSLIVLEFWRELFTTDGDSSYGATTTVGGVFATAPTKSLSGMMADLRAFWTVGAFDVASGTTFTGLSATTPREFFNAYPATHPSFTGRSATGSGSWEFADADASTGTTITGLNFASALRSLHVYEGYSSQVQSVWTWLMTFESNPSFISAAGTLATDFSCVSTNNAANPPAPPTGQGNVTPPAYDPTLALTTTLLVRDSTASYAAMKQNGTALYEWGTLGMMAAIQSVQNGGAFRRAKDAVSSVRFRLPVDFSYEDQTQEDYAVLRAQTGLAFQMGVAGAKLWTCSRAANIGAIYRYQPQSWTGTNPPTQQPGLRI